jgi:prepilin-type N-terminal cleavage/methylation domain-containing protein
MSITNKEQPPTVGNEQAVGRGLAPGFTVAELVIVIAVIGILAVMAVPSFLTYLRAAALKSGAQQVVTLVNQARELAIKENTKVCAKRSSATQMTYVLNSDGSCVGSGPWIGTGTDAAGNIQLPVGITVTASGNGAIFDYVGSAVTAPATYTLTYTQTGATLTVSVAASGRITIP